MDYAITATNLTKVFEVNNTRKIAVNSISFNIKPGKIIGLLGPNGAGKTTTIRLIASLFNPTSGTSYVNNLDSKKDSLEVRKIIGLSHERPSFYSKLTGRRNLRFYAELYDVPEDEIDSRINYFTDEFDLTSAIDQPVGSYSKGMVQKLSICKALIHQAPIIFLDEPWAGLSPGATRDLRHKIKRLGIEQDKTILITTHNLAQAEQVVDELMIISDGKIIAEGSPDQLREEYHVIPELRVKLANPRHDTNELRNLEYIHDIKIDGDNLIFLIESFDFTPELVKHLIHNNYAIHEVNEVIPSLEEIYLNLVEKD